MGKILLSRIRCLGCLGSIFGFGVWVRYDGDLDDDHSGDD